VVLSDVRHREIEHSGNLPEEAPPKVFSFRERLETSFRQFIRPWALGVKSLHLHPMRSILTVLGIFARLCHRDGKDGYLKDMPRVLAYLRQTCERYLELRPLARLLDQLEDRRIDVGFTF